MRDFTLISQQIGKQFLIVKLPVPPVNFWNLGFKVGQVALGEAAHYVDALYQPLVLACHLLQYGVDAFLFGIGNEATGVHHHHLSLRVRTVVRHLIAMSLEKPHKNLAVNKIL